jgi:hypothetical protein
LRAMIDHPPCSILNVQRLALTSWRPGESVDAPPWAAARCWAGALYHAAPLRRACSA